MFWTAFWTGRQSAYRRGAASLFFGTQRSTDVFRQLQNPLQGNAHDSAKRLSLQEVSPNPVLQPLSRIYREPNYRLVVSPETYSNSVKEYDNERQIPNKSARDFAAPDAMRNGFSCSQRQIANDPNASQSK